MEAALEAFCKISKVLTGENHLDPSLAELHLTRLQTTSEARSSLDRLLEVSAIIEEREKTGGDIAEVIRVHVMNDDNLRGLAGMIVILWFLGDLKTLDAHIEPGSPGGHFEGLFWKIIHAHPPALSGGYFGHWTYPPDN